MIRTMLFNRFVNRAGKLFQSSNQFVSFDAVYDNIKIDKNTYKLTERLKMITMINTTMETKMTPPATPHNT